MHASLLYSDRSIWTSDRINAISKLILLIMYWELEYLRCFPFPHYALTHFFKWWKLNMIAWLSPSRRSRICSSVLNYLQHNVQWLNDSKVTRPYFSRVLFFTTWKLLEVVSSTRHNTDKTWYLRSDLEFFASWPPWTVYSNNRSTASMNDMMKLKLFD
jgi:hypothetical protein